MLKAAIKHSSGEDQVRHRVVPLEAVSKWSTKLDEMKAEMSEILQEEKEEKEVRVVVSRINDWLKRHTQLRQAEMELKKGQNMLEHEKEIYSRPARTWFQSGKDKLKAEGICYLLVFIFWNS
jgi:ATP-dependent RNA helicase DDX27